jgi:hypothetical protein
MIAFTYTLVISVKPLYFEGMRCQDENVNGSFWLSMNGKEDEYHFKIT